MRSTKESTDKESRSKAESCGEDWVKTDLWLRWGWVRGGSKIAWSLAPLRFPMTYQFKILQTS